MSWPQLYLGVALTTLATLLLELSITRIYSVVFYYHFAFLAISLALFGLGAGGVFSYYVASRPGGFFSKLGTLAVLNGLAVLAALLFILSRPAELRILSFALIYFSSSIPFFLSGTVLSLAIGETVERINRVYFVDLLGAAAGCLLLVPLLNVMGGPNTVMAAGVIFAVSAAIWFNLAGRGRARAAAVVLALAIVFLIAINGKLHLVDVRYAKGQKLAPESFVKWNSFSRIAIAKQGPGLGIYIDADAATGIAKFNWEHFTDAQRDALLHQGPGFVYDVRPAAKTLIIGPGGGWDVARALASGSTAVTGVEINPIIARTIMQERFPHLSNSLYLRPEVHIVVEDGRSFVRGSSEKYQVIEATLVDTWASTAAGAFALSENNLYTSDAFYDYLNHLTADGLLSFTRWGFQPPRESLRLLSLAMDALRRLGQTDPSRHFIVLREHSDIMNSSGAQDTVLISRTPFTDADLTHVRTELARSRWLQSVYIPGDPASSSAFAGLLLSPDPRRFRDEYQYNISPRKRRPPIFLLQRPAARSLELHLARQ
jgi:predicted membrane-bound spermidine synthase